MENLGRGNIFPQNFTRIGLATAGAMHLAASFQAPGASEKYKTPTGTPSEGPIKVSRPVRKYSAAYGVTDRASMSGSLHPISRPIHPAAKNCRRYSPRLEANECTLVKLPAKTYGPPRHATRLRSIYTAARRASKSTAARYRRCPDPH